MEYACNGSLRGFINQYQNNRWRLSQVDLISMFLDIAFGLKYLHTHNIIHRDMKPENMLMVEDYRIKIGEFIKKLGYVCNNFNFQLILGFQRYLKDNVERQLELFVT